MLGDAEISGLLHSNYTPEDSQKTNAEIGVSNALSKKLGRRPQVQSGGLERTGNRTVKWKGHYYEYIKGKRVHKAVVLGSCEDISEAKARQMLMAHILDSATKKVMNAVYGKQCRGGNSQNIS